MTDDLNLYRGIGRDFSGGHGVIRHKGGRYADGDVNTNTVESFFGLLNRAHFGIHHHTNKMHLKRYVVERCFMWNHRQVTDGERMVAAIEGAEGRRLKYREPV